MTFLPFTRNAAFNPETNRVMAAAFDCAWQSLQSSGNVLAVECDAAITREIIAKRIIELAQDGERNSDRLYQGASGISPCLFRGA